MNDSFKRQTRTAPRSTDRNSMEGKVKIPKFVGYLHAECHKTLVVVSTT